MNNLISHVQILNIADHLKTQKYAFNKHRGDTITKYVLQQQKVTKLLELYRLEKVLKEQYQTNGSTLQRQKILDDIRNVAEEINVLEESLT